MHTALTGGFTHNGTTFTAGAAKIAQGDNFLRLIVPQIMASQAYQNNGAIIIWFDESEPDGSGNQNDFNHTIAEIVISKLAHPSVNGVPFASLVNLTHSDDLRTLQNIFGIAPLTASHTLAMPPTPSVSIVCLRPARLQRCRKPTATP